MGVRIVHDRDQGLAALFCSTSDFAFGPVFSRTREHDCLVACWQVRYGKGFAAADVMAEHDDPETLKAAKKENGLRSLQHLIGG